jgi:hypothetical protein
VFRVRNVELKDVRKPIEKNPNAVSAVQRSQNLGDLRSPTAPPASHRNGQTKAAEVTPLSHCAVNSFPGNRQAHRPPRAADCCQLETCLAQRIPLSQARAGHGGIFNGSRPSVSLPPCSTPPQHVRRWRRTRLRRPLRSSHARDRLHQVCSRVSLAGRSI